MDTLNKRLQKRIHISLYVFLFLTGLLGLSVLLEGCSDKCTVQNEYVYFEPVYTSLNEVRDAVEVVDPKQITSVGKIYFKAGWLFVNEPGEGIHIFDNRDPAHPLAKSFLKIPGNYDLAIKNNTLYADSYIDLVVFDITDIDHINETNRLENIFSNYNSLGFYMDAQRGLVTDWKEAKEVTVYESDCEMDVQPWGGAFYNEGIAWSSSASFDSRAAIAPGNGSVSGVGGSMARFTINADHLYTLDGGDVQAINISNESNPVAASRTNIAWDMETIFPYGNNLFIGSRSGMHILDISSPAVPVKISTYEHVRVCDPVVVQDDLAFVTLRSGSECEGFTNQLEVINIKNLNSPQLLEVYPMTNPHGLGIDGNTLFICDGSEGLKVYDAADISKIDEHQLAHYAKINAFDVIPFDNVLMMIGSDGIFQYDYSNPKDIRFLSKIEIAHENE
jgi:hypothetical protein